MNADRARIEQVVCNLLDNADKFSPEDKAIRVRIAQQDKQAVLEVSDEGQGIAPEMLEQIFNLFVQVPGSGSLGRGHGRRARARQAARRNAWRHGQRFEQGPGTRRGDYDSSTGGVKTSRRGGQCAGGWGVRRRAAHPGGGRQ